MLHKENTKVLTKYFKEFNNIFLLAMVVCYFLQQTEDIFFLSESSVAGVLLW